MIGLGLKTDILQAEDATFVSRENSNKGMTKCKIGVVVGLSKGGFFGVSHHQTTFKNRYEVNLWTMVLTCQ